MDFLPVFLDLKGRKCVVVGGGEVARRKASRLLEAGAALHVVATSVTEELRALCRQHGAAVSESRFQPDHLRNAVLAIAATDDEGVNRAVSVAASESGIPVNVVDRPELCTCIMPAIVDRSPVVVAISSGGSSPLLTRKLKELNEVMLPTGIDRLARLLGAFRPRVQAKISDFGRRTEFWERILDSEIPELVYAGDESQARERLEAYLEQGNDSATRPGEVYLVGAGPGDPDLLTLRALRLMQKADVVLYDRLVSPEIMQKLRPDADRVHVGKQQAQPGVGQEGINQMLVRLARAGNRVLRLKGGDPFIFGRGGEELETLAAAGVPFQVVPGITAASGCAAYAGIPLTHRDHAHSVRFMTGHLRDGKLDLDWHNLARQREQTLVFYMGLSGLATICRELVRHGMDAATPIAVIQQGTTGDQRVFTSDLATMPLVAQTSEIKAPTITIIGSVVNLREGLNWFAGSGTESS